MVAATNPLRRSASAYRVVEDLAQHDAVAPSNTKQLGYSEGILTARIAASQARLAQRQLECGDDCDGISIHAILAKKEFSLSEEMAELDNIMIAVQGVTRQPTSEQYRV